MASLEIRLLGPVEVAVDGHVVRPSAPKVRALLGLLAMRRDRPVAADVIADVLWSGQPPASAGSVVRTYVTKLRRLLPEGDVRLARDGSGYVLRLGEDELDVARFQALIDAGSARSTSTRGGLALFDEALALWRGEPLVDLADDASAQAEAARLHELRWIAVERAADAELALGRHEPAVARLEAAVREAPMREQLVRRLMIALHRSGRQAEAIEAFQRLRRELVDGMGLEPSAELRSLEAAVLAQDPALDAPPVLIGNVPAVPTSFIGRAAEMERLQQILPAARAVTLVGAGGSGKTRLAVEAAGTLASSPSLPDGVWFVDLSGRRRGDEVARAVLSTLSLGEGGDRGDLADVCSALADRRLLLVLDNCEHLLDASASLVAAVLGSCRGTVVLATSRTPLGVGGEVVVEVPPLSTAASSDRAVAPATELLADRVSAARGGVPPGQDEWSVLGRLCQQIDGLPLAIELVGAQARTIALHDLADALASHALEVDGRTSGPDHHRSLTACVRWSLDLLDDDDRHLIRCVSLLPGWFSPRAAAAVTGRVDVLRGLSALAARSLLQAAPVRRSRFRMLETVRQVVVRELPLHAASESLDSLVAALADWAEAVEPELRGPGAAQVLDELEDDLDALHAALEHGLERADPTDAVRLAAAVSSVWAHRGHFHEGRVLLERAVATADHLEPLLRLRLLIAAGIIRNALGDVEGFRGHVDAALELARSTPADAEVLRTLLWAAHALHLRAQHDAAASLYREALELARAVDDQGSVGSAFAGLGDVAVASADLDAAAQMNLRALAAFRLAGDPHGEGQAHLNLGEVERLAGRIEAAQDAFERAQEVFETIGDRSCVAAADEGRARIAADTARLDDAEALYRRAVAVRVELRQEHRAAADLQALASVLFDLGRPEEAATALGAAGDDRHGLVATVRAAIGERAFLTAWATGAGHQRIG